MHLLLANEIIPGLVSFAVPYCYSHLVNLRSSIIVSIFYRCRLLSSSGATGKSPPPAPPDRSVTFPSDVMLLLLLLLLTLLLCRIQSNRKRSQQVSLNGIGRHHIDSILKY